MRAARATPPSSLRNQLLAPSESTPGWSLEVGTHLAAGEVGHSRGEGASDLYAATAVAQSYGAHTWTGYYELLLAEATGDGATLAEHVAAVQWARLLQPQLSSYVEGIGVVGSARRSFRHLSRRWSRLAGACTPRARSWCVVRPGRRFGRLSLPDRRDNPARATRQDWARRLLESLGATASCDRPSLRLAALDSGLPVSRGRRSTATAAQCAVDHDR